MHQTDIQINISPTSYYYYYYVYKEFHIKRVKKNQNLSFTNIKNKKFKY